MNLLDKLINHIYESKYKKISLEEIKFDTFYNEVDGKLIIIFNEQIRQDSSFREEINNVAKDIRDIIKNDNFNLWNAYLLVLVNKNSFKEKYYYIERDVRNLRKYVIQNENDILRIPFISFEKNIKDSDQTKGHNYSVSEELKKLYESLKDRGGNRKKLTNSEIDKTMDETRFLEVRDD
ncbi:ABC-three component system middle component 1 [Lactococcus lactis]|uniref:ABC-three component system middle component 1 n=1 Tax=Lactococcus lactis TaxID=1358 RepID=UPI0024A72F6D|nr:ABC-three component system middle component 1 [Lactococcus lactis]